MVSLSSSIVRWPSCTCSLRVASASVVHFLSSCCAVIISSRDLRSCFLAFIAYNNAKCYSKNHHKGPWTYHGQWKHSYISDQRFKISGILSISLVYYLMKSESWHVDWQSEEIINHHFHIHHHWVHLFLWEVAPHQHGCRWFKSKFSALGQCHHLSLLAPTLNVLGNDPLHTSRVSCKQLGMLISRAIYTNSRVNDRWLLPISKQEF